MDQIAMTSIPPRIETATALGDGMLLSLSTFRTRILCSFHNCDSDSEDVECEEYQMKNKNDIISSIVTVEVENTNCFLNGEVDIYRGSSRDVVGSFC